MVIVTESRRNSRAPGLGRDVARAPTRRPALRVGLSCSSAVVAPLQVLRQAPASGWRRGPTSVAGSARRQLEHPSHSFSLSDRIATEESSAQRRRDPPANTRREEVHRPRIQGSLRAWLEHVCRHTDHGASRCDRPKPHSPARFPLDRLARQLHRDAQHLHADVVPDPQPHGSTLRFVAHNSGIDDRCRRRISEKPKDPSGSCLDPGGDRKGGLHLTRESFPIGRLVPRQSASV